MREVTLTVPRRAVEDVLDRLLPIVAGGVREVSAGRRAQLRIRGADIPDPDVLVEAAGRWPYRISEREVPDDWRERRLLDYEPKVIGGRLLVRPDWAPPPKAGLIDIVVADNGAFGTGSHPSTRTCLELMLQLPPAGAFADLGCGSGVLAVLAARLGWFPVTAVDIQPESVAATAANAAANAAQVESEVLDLSIAPPPAVEGMAANVPAALHEILAQRMPPGRPSVAIVSGFGQDEAPGVLGAYEARGMYVRQRCDPHNWCVVILERD